jgi:hypothetical protein
MSAALWPLAIGAVLIFDVGFALGAIWAAAGKPDTNDGVPVDMKQGRSSSRTPPRL